jgi:hypothetical protein
LPSIGTDETAEFCAVAASISVIVLFMPSMPRTVLIWASWLVTSALSIGFIGSWLRIWATSSCRNRSSVPSAESAAAVEDSSRVTPSA